MGFRQKDGPNATVTKKFRVTPEDALEIETKARKSGLTFSEYVRRCALGRRTAARYDIDAVEAITRLAESVGQLRNAVASGEAHFDAENFRLIGAECIRTLERMV
ncbi:plasmid mobilization protein [Paraburkholderia sp. A3RO-2L]|uniref:plasmid mobilization protein n=1 Tax=Paraburkholderia sp. A3RO-2L TaxID=3028376 RepID=UPI003DA836CB